MSKLCNKHSLPTLTAALCLMLLPDTAYGNPAGGVVTKGQATFTTTDKKLDIHQQTDKAVIDWQTFDIELDEHTQFHQPNSSSTTLNRVHDSDPSKILGKLSANGNVILINPNGVFFGENSRVDVNGLLATTSDINNDDFMSGNMQFDMPGNPDAKIINEGRITAKEAGLVGLVAPHVENRGTIQARLGRVELSSGDSFTFDMYGDGLIEIEASDNLVSQLVRNSGDISADGGIIEITASEGKSIVDSLVEVNGTVTAYAVNDKSGEILITSDGSGPAHNKIVSVPDALIAVSGDGSNIKIGGDYLGTGDTPKTDYTYIGKNTNIIAEGLNTEVIVWSEKTTIYDGYIEAVNGFVETSGKEILSATGNVLAETWLLDPYNITIQDAGPDDSVTGSPDFTSTNFNAVLTTASIEAALNNGTDVTIQTGAGGPQFGQIDVNNPIEKTSGGSASLTLNANNKIEINANIISTSNALDLILLADSNGGGSGAINIANVTITTNGGDITFGGKYDPDGVGSEYGADFAVGTTGNRRGILLDNVDISTGAGNISIKGVGHLASTSNIVAGVFINTGTTITTTSGNITIFGIGGGGTGNAYGVGIESTSTITTTNGDVNITGVGGTLGSGDNNIGILVDNSSSITSDGTTSAAGNITLNGTAGGGANGSHGIKIDRDSNVIADYGLIDITGIGSTTATGSSHGILLRHNSTVGSTGSGNITLTGVAGTTGTDSNSISFRSTSPIIGGSSATGDISFIIDSYQVINAPTIQTTGTVTFAPYTNSTTIGVGGGTGDLQIDSTFLGYLNSSVTGITIGSSSATGAINFGTYNWGADDLTVLSDSGAITFSGDQTSIEDLVITTGANLTIDNALTASGNLTLQTDGTFTLNDTISSTSSGNIDIRTDNFATGTSSVIQTSGDVTLAPFANSTTVGVAGGTGSLQLSSTILGYLHSDVTGITIGRSDGTGAVNFGANSWGSDNLNILSDTGLITFSGAQTNIADLNINTSANLTIGSALSGTGDFYLQTGGTFTLNDTITSSSSGNTAIAIDATNDFINSAGSSALSAASSRWIVYSDSPVDNQNNGLLPNASDFGKTYASDAPSTFTAGQDFYVYATSTRPILAFNVGNDNVTYGSAYSGTPSITYVSGLLGDDTLGTIGQTGSASSVSTPYSSGDNVGSYALSATQGDLANVLGYTYAFNDGTLTVDPLELSIDTVDFNDKVYDGTTNGTAIIAFSNIYSGDNVTANATTIFDNPNVGFRDVSLSGASLSGTDSGNYTLPSLSGFDSVAEITPLALIIDTVDYSDKVYDGTTNVAATVSFSNIVSGDSVTADVTATSDSKNVGFRNVSLSGGSLSGTDNGNYSLPSLSGYDSTIEITQLALIIDTIDVADKVYDGNTTATLNSVSFSNIISGDTVSFSGATATFDDKNVGTNKTVS
ncbi:MAG: YDG domain-containing protein, partial [Pseudomonadota bacterium]